MKFERIIKNEAVGSKGGISISEMQRNIRYLGIDLSEDYIKQVLDKRWGLKFIDDQHLDTDSERFKELFGSSEY